MKHDTTHTVVVVHWGTTGVLAYVYPSRAVVAGDKTNPKISRERIFIFFREGTFFCFPLKFIHTSIKHVCFFFINFASYCRSSCADSKSTTQGATCLDLVDALNLL